nr:hypothetical protein [Tanacetum cinerariifolium]
MSVPLEHDYIATELSLGLPGFSKNFEEPVSVAKNFLLGAKRGFSDVNLDVNGCFEKVQGQKGNLVDGVVKVGEEKKKNVVPSAKAQVVGWPPIRSFRKNTMATNAKIDLKVYHNYAELSKALEKMFSCFTLGQCSEAIGLAPRSTDKGKNKN